MPLSDLKGKTILIATDDGGKSMADLSLKPDLEGRGAKVFYSKQSPWQPAAGPVSGIKEQVTKHPIDAVVIYNYSHAGPGIEADINRATAVQLAGDLTCPVVVCDSCDDPKAIRSVRGAGARYFDTIDNDGAVISYAIADAIAQHSKAGRKK